LNIKKYFYVDTTEYTTKFDIFGKVGVNNHTLSPIVFITNNIEQDDSVYLHLNKSVINSESVMV